MFYAFVFVSFLQCGIAKPHIDENANDANVVKKNVFSDKFRFIHTVGIEGSGHHYFTNLHRNIFEYYPNIYKTGIIKHPDYFLPDFMGSTINNFGTMVDLFRNKMRNLKIIGDEHPGTIFSMSGPESFPNGPGRKDKVLNYMDLRLMAEMSESEGVDIRFIYLKRSALDVLVADTIHRRFQLELEPELDGEANFLKYIRILLADISIMQSLLEEIDQEFVVCHDFDKLGEINQSNTISKFVAPTEEVFRIYNSTMVKTAAVHHHHSSVSQFDYNNEYMEMIVSRIKNKLDSFEYKYC